MRGRGRRRHERGFTLLELLVVITVLGLLMVALTNGVRFAGRAWELQQQRSQRQGDLDAVHNMLRQLFASGYAFKGDAKEIKFVAPLPAALNRGGLYDVSLNAPLDELILTWTPHFKGQMAKPQPTETVLAHGVREFALGYYALKGGWRSTLQDQAPPPLIKIDLKLADGRPWPPFVVAPSIERQSGATN